MKRILVLTLFNLNILCSTDGTLNTSFNSGGSRPGTFSTFITSDSATSCQCLALAETPSGKILGAGRATIGGFAQAALMQLNGDGSLDTAFNSGGTKPGTYSAVLAGSVTSPVITSSIFNAVAIQSDGKIVAAGTSTGSAITNVLVARFNSDGSLDTSFGSSGSAVITINNTTAFSAKSVVLLSDGKILLGVARSSSPVVIGIARFNSDGSLDTGFNSGGAQPGTYVLPAISGVPLSGSSSGTLAVDSDGRYIMGSSCTVSGIAQPIVIRLDTDLALDTTFNTVGYKYFYFDGTGAATSVLGVKLQSDGKIIIFGNANFGTPAATTKACIGRLNTDGTLDTSFNSIGSTSFLYGSSDAISTFSTAVALGLMEDGKIVVSGRSSIGVSYIGIARLSSNGTLDTTFNSSGFVPGTNATTVNSGTASSIGFSGALFGSSDFICGGAGSTTNQAIFADFLMTSVSGPVASNSTAVTGEDDSVTVTMTATSDVSQQLTFATVSSPSHGTLGSITQPTTPSLTQIATVLYSPNSGYYGSDTFTFKASIGAVDSNIATATIATYSEPVAASQSVSAVENTSLPITLSATNSDGNLLFFSIDSGPAHGTLGSITQPLSGGTSQTALVTYTPDDGYVGPDSFTFVATNSVASSSPGDVLITISSGEEGSTPVAIGQSVSLYSNSSIVISLEAYNSDGNTLEFDIVEEPIHGTLSSITQPSSGGTSQKALVTYTPSLGFSGYDAFSFNASNGSAVSASSNVALFVSANGPTVPNKENLTLALIQKYY